MHAPAPGPRTSAPSATTTPNTPSYTPGPWREHSHRQIGPDAGIVCEVWSAIGESDADRIAQADANARLIAAAPDLLEALRCACNYIDKLGGTSSPYRALLARATGEQP